MQRLAVAGADGKADLRTTGRRDEDAAENVADERLDLNLVGEEDKRGGGEGGRTGNEEVEEE